ncbi:MAG: hypothetical protein HQL53_06060 [Magnetococcales bacterium]|nr:hypothetical protein [Magnetococcales bacterium]
MTLDAEELLAVDWDDPVQRDALEVQIIEEIDNIRDNGEAFPGYEKLLNQTLDGIRTLRQQLAEHQELERRHAELEREANLAEIKAELATHHMRWLVQQDDFSMDGSVLDPVAFLHPDAFVKRSFPRYFKEHPHLREAWGWNDENDFGDGRMWS